jgi:transcriptional regulator with XRE-family HTH domain
MAVGAGLHEAIADATAAAVRSELDAIGDRLARARVDESAELDRSAALVQVGTDAGLRLHEIADRVGISRQTLLNARTSGRGGPERRLNVDVRLACALGVGEAKSEQALIDAVAHGPIHPHQVSAALSRLMDAGDARLVSTRISGDRAVSYYRLTELGASRLPGRLRQATISPAREWIVYIASTSQEANAIVSAAELLLGKHEVAVIPAGTRFDMRVPEVAWRVEASSSEEAMQVAISQMRQLRNDIPGLESEQRVDVMALVYPRDACRG